MPPRPMNPFDKWDRDDAARYLSTTFENGLLPPQEFLVDNANVRMAAEWLLKGHEECTCGRAALVLRARQILLDEQPAQCEGRLAL